MTEKQHVELSRSHEDQAAGQHHVERIVIRTLLTLVGVGLVTLLLVAIWP